MSGRRGRFDQTHPLLCDKKQLIRCDNKCNERSIRTEISWQGWTGKLFNKPNFLSFWPARLAHSLCHLGHDYISLQGLPHKNHVHNLLSFHVLLSACILELVSTVTVAYLWLDLESKKQISTMLSIILASISLYNTQINTRSIAHKRKT